APAGKHGRVASRNGHFEFEKIPGVPQRFYGINVNENALTVSHEVARRAAENLARTGYNAVRLMHLKPLIRPESVTGLDFDEEALDRFDGFVCECIRNGLYLTMDFDCFRRKVSWRSIGEDKDGFVDYADGKALPWYRNRGFRENYKKYVYRLLTHVNPYTGHRYADEPAFVWFGYLNEPYSHKGYPKDEWRRIGEDERNFACDMNSFLRNEIGSKTLTANHNGLWFPVFLQVPRVAGYDVVDCHYYIEHPDFGDKTWGAPNRLTNENVFRKESMGGLSIATHRDFRKPFVVSEWNACAPSSRRMSASVGFTAYAALQDWDGLWRFDWCWDDHGFRWPEIVGVSWFAMCGDPMRRATERAGIALFQRRDLAPLDDAWCVEINPGDIDLADSRCGLSMWRKNMSSLGWKVRLGSSIGPHPADSNILGSFPEAFTNDSSSLAARLKGVGENTSVIVSRAEGSFRIDTLRFKGVAADGGCIGVDGFEVSVSGAPATVFALSLDGMPLQESGRVLVSHLTDLQNEGVEYEDETRRLCLKVGNGRVPQLARVGRADMFIGRTVATRSMTSSSESGCRVFRSPFDF
ncbi:MAG: cellulase family glycosylhydrolase, partial [Victivallales bacterium]|nr:cellulase family glycosylhydrolase [Victivallales bacterium]